MGSHHSDGTPCCEFLAASIRWGSGPTFPPRRRSTGVPEGPVKRFRVVGGVGGLVGFDGCHLVHLHLKSPRHIYRHNMFPKYIR